MANDIKFFASKTITLTDTSLGQGPMVNFDALLTDLVA